MSICRILFAVLSLLIVTTPQVYAEEITLVTDTWTGYTNLDNTGYYLDILKIIFPEPAYTLTMTHMPYKRTLLMVEKGLADMTTGVNPGDMPNGFIAGQYLEIDQIDVAITTKIASQWQGLRSLKNKTVVAKVGYAFANAFDVPIHYSEKSSLVAMLRMLGAGRVDAVLDYQADLRKVWDRAGLNDNFTILTGVISNKAYMAFSKKRYDLRSHFEKRFTALIQDGTIARIGKRYGMAPENLPHSQP